MGNGYVSWRLVFFPEFFLIYYLFGFGLVFVYFASGQNFLDVDRPPWNNLLPQESGSHRLVAASGFLSFH